MTPKRWLIVIVSFAAAIGVSLYIVHRSWPAGGAPVALPARAHLLALLAVLLEIVTRATKIKLSAHAIRVPLRFGTSLRTCLGGDIGATITPARAGAEQRLGGPMPSRRAEVHAALYACDVLGASILGNG